MSGVGPCIYRTIILTAAALTAQAGQAGDSLGPGTPLKGFHYELSPTYLQELGRRIGCDRAADLVAQPAGMSMPQAVDRILAATAAPGVGRTYHEIRRVLWNRPANRKLCEAGASGVVNDPVAGLKALTTAVKARHAAAGRDVGVTVVVIGGLGSYMVDNTLRASFDLWQPLAEQTPDDLRLLRVNCSQYADNAVCAPEVLKRIMEFDAAQPRVKEQRFVLWGYSMGGLTALEILAQSPELREKTDVVVSMAAPLGGAAVSRILVPILDELIRLKASDPAAFAAGKLLVKGILANGGDISGFGPLTDDLEGMRRTYAGLLPDRMRQDLETRLKMADFSRKTPGRILFLQAAGVHDLAEIPGLPVMTVKDGALALKEKSVHVQQGVELAGMSLVRDHPLSDPLVALEHATLPRDLIPAGLDARLLAAINLDHSALGHSAPDLGRSLRLQFLEMVDALMATVAAEVAR